MRHTAAGLKAQFKKLVKPFRSPLVKSEDELAGREAVYATAHMYPVLRKGPPKIETGPADDRGSTPTEKAKDSTAATLQPAKTFNARLTKQFKSPFVAPGSGSSSSASRSALFSSTKLTQAAQIQALQAKVQKLKQAIKIKNERTQADEQNLEALVSKWRSVGRDVSWLVWDTVKDLDPGEALNAWMGKGGWGDEDGPRGDKLKGKKKGGFDGGWGYDDGKKSGGYGGLDKSWGWEEQPKVDGDETVDENGEMDVDEGEEQSQSHSLGTMLRHMGIDPETLGWDEDEGDFVGEP